MEQTFVFSDSAPYPPVQVCGANPMYARAMLANIGSCNSEMSAVSLYFYNSIITKPIQQDVAECFHKISIVEMHHLEIFGQLAKLLGADPDSGTGPADARYIGVPPAINTRRNCRFC